MLETGAGGIEARGNDAAVVEDEEVAGLEDLGEVAKVVVCEGAGVAIEPKHAAFAPDVGWRLCDEVFGEIEVEVADAHFASLRKAWRAGGGERHGAVEGCLYGGLGDGSPLCLDVRGPGDKDAGEGFWDEEAVPGAELPGAVGEGVEGTDLRGVDDLCELGGAGLGYPGGTAWAVGGDGADVALVVGTGETSEAGGSGAGGGAADGAEAEALDGTGDELAVEGLADEDGDVPVAEAVGADEERAVPEDEDGGAGQLIAGDCSWIGYVFVAEGGAEQTDESGRERRDEGERELPAGGELLGVRRHVCECTSSCVRSRGRLRLYARQTFYRRY